MTIIFVLGVIAFSSSSKSTVHSADDDVRVAPSFGGCRGTYTIFPPGISMLLMYLDHSWQTDCLDIGEMTHWSKNGSKIMTSSPGSMNAMNALSMPSFAPVVIVTSVSGLSFRPQKGS